jgi:hypothetical protein
MITKTRQLINNVQTFKTELIFVQDDENASAYQRSNVTVFGAAVLDERIDQLRLNKIGRVELIQNQT